MVEKVSEISMNIAMNGDSTPDDNALLKHIAKKKKQEQGSEAGLPVAMLPPGSLVQLTTTLVLRGGVQKTEKQVVKEDIPASLGLATDTRQTKKEYIPASLGLATDTRQTKKDDGLRRQTALAVAGQMAMPDTGKKPVSDQKGMVTSALGRKVAASEPKSESLSVNNKPLNIITNAPVDTVTKFQQPMTVQQSQSAAMANPLIVNKSTQEAETGLQDKRLRAKDDFGEVRPFWQGMKPEENLLPKQGETTAQSKNSPATLQQLKSQASTDGGVKGGNESQALEVNYQFQRWSGDHSVRVSVPTEARREGNVTLLPSDARAADVLLRNMGHLTGLNPDLLRPQQERDEQQQRRQQQQQDEDQE